MFNPWCPFGPKKSEQDLGFRLMCGPRVYPNKQLLSAGLHPIYNVDSSYRRGSLSSLLHDSLRRVGYRCCCLFLPFPALSACRSEEVNSSRPLCRIGKEQTPNHKKHSREQHTHRACFANWRCETCRGHTAVRTDMSAVPTYAEMLTRFASLLVGSSVRRIQHLRCHMLAPLRTHHTQMARVEPHHTMHADTADRLV